MDMSPFVPIFTVDVTDEIVFCEFAYITTDENKVRDRVIAIINRCLIGFFDIVISLYVHNFIFIIFYYKRVVPFLTS